MPILADYFIVVSVPTESTILNSFFIVQEKTLKQMEWSRQSYIVILNKIIRNIVSLKTRLLYNLLICYVIYSFASLKELKLSIRVRNNVNLSSLLSVSLQSIFLYSFIMFQRWFKKLWYYLILLRAFELLLCIFVISRD